MATTTEAPAAGTKTDAHSAFVRKMEERRKEGE